MLVLSPARSAQVYFKVPEPTPSAEPSVSDIVREIDADAGAAR